MIKAKNKFAFVMILAFTLAILGSAIACYCGDGIINQANETCDNGVLNGNVCSPLYGSSCTYCSTQCKNVTLTGPYCGDSTCNGAETCSTCSADCGVCAPVCGNGIKEACEQCDLGILNGNVCSPLYGNSCTYCSTQCKNVTLTGPYCGDSTCNGAETCSTCASDCGVCPPQPKCGDGIINQANETCDKGALNGQVCSPLYGSSCTYCCNQCKNVTLTGPYCGDSTCNGAETCSTCSQDCGVCAPVCGNGIKEAGEQCDDHNLLNNDGCSSTCKTEVCGDNICNNGETCSTCASDCGVCAPVCGNGIKEACEQCDKGALNGQACSPLYGSSCTYCSTQCKNVTLTGPYCGDSTCNGAETCSTCASDCGVCADTTNPTVDITNPIATTYSSQRTSLTFNVYDEHLNSCTYKLNGASQVNVSSLINGVNTITGISSVAGTNTWSVNCKDNSGNTGSDSITFIVTIPPTCGDNTCNGAETCSTCSADCGVCPPPQPTCGDGTCNNGETCSTCASDCGTCPTPQPTCVNSKSNSFVQLCDTNWVCSSWSECSDGVMTRNCIDKNNCDTEDNKPNEQSDCKNNVLSNAYVEKENINPLWIILGVVLFVLLLLVIIYMLK